MSFEGEKILMQKYGLLPLLPETDDHQSSGAYQECHRMSYYKDILGRKPMGESFNLLWGRAVHRMVEFWHKYRDLDLISQYIDQTIDVTTEDRYGRDRGRFYQLVAEWIKFNETNPLEILHTEQPITIWCKKGTACPYSPTGCGLKYGGRLDDIVRWDRMAGPLDVKTSVYDDTDPVSEYKPSHQMAGYIWLTTHLVGYHVWGVIVERIICNKSKLYVKRFPVSYAKDLIIEWSENEVIVQAEKRERFEKYAYSEKHWLQNHFRCWKPFACHYRDVCLSPRDLDFRMKLLRDQFPERRWDFNNPDGEVGVDERG